MSNTNQEIEIDVRDVTSADADFAWPIYRDFIRENIFSSGNNAGNADKWNEAEEKGKFSDRWSAEDCYVIEVNGEVSGWITTDQEENVLTVENIFLVDKWQNKGIATRIVREMMPVWEKENILVNIPVLKNAPLTVEIENTLQSLGLTTRTEDEMTKVYGKDWR